MINPPGSLQRHGLRPREGAPPRSLQGGLPRVLVRHDPVGLHAPAQGSRLHGGHLGDRQAAPRDGARDNAGRYIYQARVSPLLVPHDAKHPHILVTEVEDGCRINCCGVTVSSPPISSSSPTMAPKPPYRLNILQNTSFVLCSRTPRNNEMQPTHRKGWGREDTEGLFGVANIGKKYAESSTLCRTHRFCWLYNDGRSLLLSPHWVRPRSLGVCLSWLAC